MERPLHPLERDLEALHDAWADSMPAFGAIAGSVQVEVEQMSDAGLVRMTDLIAQVRRDADVLLTRVAAEAAKRSGPEFGDTGLAKAQGFHNPIRLIAASTGASRNEAAKLIAVGVATAERQSFGGERARVPRVPRRRCRLPRHAPCDARAVEFPLCHALQTSSSSRPPVVSSELRARQIDRISHTDAASRGSARPNGPTPHPIRGTREGRFRGTHDFGAGRGE